MSHLADARQTLLSPPTNTTSTDSHESPTVTMPPARRLSSETSLAIARWQNRARPIGPRLIRSAVCILTLLAGSGEALTAADITPLPNAHAHNDYEHQRPLLDALDQGFCSVEADIHLVDGRLLVAHDRSGTRPDRDLDSLYLTPLHERVKKHGGRVHPGHPDFTLLIDFKTEAGPTYAAIKPLLAEHADMLTTFGPDGVRKNAVTVILSGNKPSEEMRPEATRLAAIDGRMKDLAGTEPATWMPLVSERWGALFKWRGSGPLPEDEAARLRELVQKAHAQGRRIRFWAIPDNPAGWAAVTQAGVDLVNTDHLAELRQFLLANPPR